MKLDKAILLLFVFLFVSLAPNLFASTNRVLSWEDLIPETAQFHDPFEALDRENLEYLGFVARIREMISSGLEVSPGTKKELSETEQLLLSKEIEIDTLLSRREEIRQLRMKRASEVVPELNGASVKMPGYLLPLEYSGQAITEFLLVPWVGACIHTPPPPPNQIVHVKLGAGNPYKSKSMFEPVWVSGEMLTQNETKNLFLKDGSGDINMGYKMIAKEVVKY